MIHAASYTLTTRVPGMNPTSRERPKPWTRNDMRVAGANKLRLDYQQHWTTRRKAGNSSISGLGVRGLGLGFRVRDLGFRVGWVYLLGTILKSWSNLTLY